MFLAFKLSNLITVPFGWVLGQLYHLCGSYGLAMVFFAAIVYMVMLPITAKSKKSMMKMSRLQPRLQDIQKRYASDPQKQNEMVQKLYQEENVGMTGGCLWSLVPLMILIPLFSVIREPMVYVLGVSSEVAAQVVEIIKAAAPDAFTGNQYYHQVVATELLPQYAEQVTAVIPTISEAALAGINFEFLGIDFGAIPQFNIFGWEKYDWAHLGLFLVPLLSAGSQVLSMWVTQKMNNSVITNEKGVQDEETAANSAAAQSTKSMMIVGPLMSLWIGFTVPCALSLYWFVGGVVRLIQDVILTKHYRKIYDAEDALRLQKALEQDAIEAEKERVRAQRRAANPDGITANTSKKKLQKAEAQKEAAQRAAAAKKYNEERGIVEEEKPEKETLSGISDRPYCKGRAYDPNRYSRNSEE